MVSPSDLPLDHIDRATARLSKTLDGLADDDVRRPSLLPGWTRGHVITHLARNADALTNLLRWARTKTPQQAYASQEARNAGIEDGARRSARKLRADFVETAEKFRAEANALPADRHDFLVRVLNYPEFPAAQIPLARWVELELHHTDLDLGYAVADWPEAFARLTLPDPMRSQRDDRISWMSQSPANS